jgi:hypothetical protein
VAAAVAASMAMLFCSSGGRGALLQWLLQKEVPVIRKHKYIEPQSHYEITSHPKTNIEPQRRGGRRDQREKRFIYRADTEKNTEGLNKGFMGEVSSFQSPVTRKDPYEYIEPPSHREASPSRRERIKETQRRLQGGTGQPFCCCSCCVCRCCATVKTVNR